MNELVKQARKGDKESFSILIDKVKNSSYKIAYSYLRNQEDAMDAVCESILIAFKNIHKLKQVEFFETWFTRIVINESKKLLKTRKKTDRLVEMIQNRESEYKDEEHKEELILLKEKMRNMKPDDRKIIYLKFYMGYKFKDIAEKLGISENTVKSRAYRGIEALKKVVE